MQNNGQRLLDSRAMAALALATGAAGAPVVAAEVAGSMSSDAVASHAIDATLDANEYSGTGNSSNYAWADLVLQDGGWSTCSNNVNVITEWMQAEEPPSDWWDRYNPLNNGDGSGGGAGLGSYPNLPTAAYFVAANLETGEYGYGAIENDLAACDTPQTTATAIWDSDWASSHYGYGTDWSFAAVPSVIPPFTWEQSAAPMPTAVQVVPTPDGGGYWILSSIGAVYAYGDAQYYGGANGDMSSSETAVGLAPTSDGDGYWIVANDGAVFSFGNAGYHGGANGGDFTNGQTAVSITGDYDGAGYWILSNEGGVFAFGDAPFYGSAYGQSYFSSQTGKQLVKAGTGYWILSKTGDIYSYGSANYYGNPPITGVAEAMTAGPSDEGYQVLSSTGAVYGMGDAPYEGGANGQSYFNGLTAVSLGATSDDAGYWILSNLGGIYSYGDAVYYGGGI
jgi:hypothetical protein